MKSALATSLFSMLALAASTRVAPWTRIARRISALHLLRVASAAEGGCLPRSLDFRPYLDSRGWSELLVRAAEEQRLGVGLAHLLQDEKERLAPWLKLVPVWLGILLAGVPVLVVTSMVQPHRFIANSG